MKRLKRNNFKRVLIVLTALALTVCLAAACQPTPDRPIVITKANDPLENKVTETQMGEPQSYEAPSSWQESYELYGGKLKMHVDADITMPDVTAYPVLKAVPGKISQDMADKIVKNLFGDTPVYETRTKLTKAQLQVMLLQTKDEYNREQDPEAQKTLSEQISEIEKAIVSAPETSESKLLDTIFKTDEQGAQYISGYAHLGYDNAAGNNPATINIKNGGVDSPYSSVSFCNSIDDLAYYTGSSDDPEGLSITKEQAIQSAADFLTEIGVTDMKPAYVEMLSEWKNDDPIDDKLAGYRVYFEREAFGIQVPFRVFLGAKPPEDMTQDLSSSMAYRQSLPAEELWITICEDGIREFIWSGVTQVSEKVSENAPLLPFDDIKEKFTQMMGFKYSYYENEKNNITETYYIDHIELGFARIAVPNDLNSYMFVPAWAFYGGTTSAGYTDENGDTQQFEVPYPDAARRSLTCLLAVNAVDGSVIDSY